MLIDKNQLFQILQQTLEKELIPLKRAALATYEDATHEETKPENKYDTRALEASYLAGAQAQRVKEIEELILICKFHQVRVFGELDLVAIGALVHVDVQDKQSWFLLLPKGGGFSVLFEGKTIQIMTPASPVGKALLGLSVGDTALVQAQGNKQRNYTILALQ